MNATDLMPHVVDSYNKGKSDGRKEALNDVVRAFEKIDNCEFASFTLCLIREVTEELKEK